MREVDLLGNTIGNGGDCGKKKWLVPYEVGGWSSVLSGCCHEDMGALFSKNM